MTDGPTGDSPLASFIARLQTDEDLRQRVAQAETQLADTIRQETANMTAIAADAGYDISGWSNPPQITGPTPAELIDAGFCCSLTCCVVSTSTNQPPAI